MQINTTRGPLTFDSCYKCQTNTTENQKSQLILPIWQWTCRYRVVIRIATRRFNQCISRLDSACLLGLLDHSKRNTVLDTTASIKVFKFCIDRGFNSQALWEPIQSDKRSVPNMLRYAVKHARWDDRLWCAPHGSWKILNASRLIEPSWNDRLRVRRFYRTLVANIVMRIVVLNYQENSEILIIVYKVVPKNCAMDWVICHFAPRRI